MSHLVFRKKDLIRQFLSWGGKVLSLCLLLLLSTASDAASQPPRLSGHLLIVGSTALQPLTTAAAKLFMRENPGVSLDVRGGGSLFGLDAVNKLQADIGQSDVYADPALYPDPDLTDHIVCVVPFAIIVNPDVPLASLTQQELIDIFSTGKLQNWQDVGGPDLPIRPVVRSDTSGTRASFLRYVLDGEPERENIQSADSSQGVLKLVTSISGAVGYLALPALKDSSVRTVAIDNEQATPEAIAQGKYAFWGYEHMYTMATNRNSLLPSFLSFMLTAPVQAEAKHMGYIPLAQIQLPG